MGGWVYPLVVRGNQGRSKMEILLIGADGKLGLYEVSSEKKEKTFLGFAEGIKKEKSA